MGGEPDVDVFDKQRAELRPVCKQRKWDKVAFSEYQSLSKMVG